ncbi:SnoaL-like domain protein [compost metagenome]
MNAQLENRVDPAIRAFLESWLLAVKAADVDAIASHYATDIVAFDAIIQLQFKGVEAYMKHWQKCLSMCTNMVFDIHELGVESSGDVAFGHYLAWCGGTDEKGETNASWMRASFGLRREQGKWKVAHEHFSAPFDVETGKAIFDAKP